MVNSVGVLPRSAAAAILPVAMSISAAWAAEPVTAIVGATIFDATGAGPRTGTVLIRRDRIIAVGSDVATPPGAKIIDARGKALLPGFFDIHTHWTPNGDLGNLPAIATAYVRSGVTTVNDFHEQPESFAPRRAWLASLVAPHVRFAARISTPGGHGADWGDQATTIWINTPEAAKAAIGRLSPYKPDLIKAFTDGWRYGNAADNTSMDEGTLRALVESSHAQGLKVVTHTVTVDRGAVAARAGVDALAHGLQDRPIDDETLQAIVSAKMAVAPTLAVYEPKGRDPSDPQYQRSLHKFEIALQNVKTMYAAGVPVALGTDAGMPGTAHGSSTLHEFELLVRAGLTPAQALIAGTATSAKILGLDSDRGTITTGKRADLVLVDGKPWEQIADVRRIDRVLIDGRLVVGAGAPSLPPGNAATRLESAQVGPLVDDFERPDGRTGLDTLRLETPDGGIDRSVEISQIVPRGNGHVLQLSARLAIKGTPYVGVAFPLTRGSVQPVTLKSYRGIRFDLKGHRDIVVRLTGPDGSWATTVQGLRDWKSFAISFADLKPGTPGRGQQQLPWNPGAVYELEIGASGGPGDRLVLELDNIRFW